MNKLINEIKKKSKDLYNANNDELKNSIVKLKKRAEKEGLEEILIDWFAIVQEVSFRELGLRHFDTQLLAGILLHEGKIVEMKTGEGKTLASSLPVSLNALSKKGVHVVTVNDYLAQRDEQTMGKIYNYLELKSGLVINGQNSKEKKKNYLRDITYLTNSEVVFDYLRDSCAYNLEEIVQRPFHFCVIDEIDSILIDEARTPLILSNYQGEPNRNKLSLAKKVANNLEKEIDFQLDEKRRDINLTEKGYKKCQSLLGKKSLYDPEDPWILEILNALKAKYLFKLNKDYIILKNKIVIVDEFTGRVMEDRRWSMGIHEAIETKENVEIGSGTKTKTAITYQNFFPLYPKIAGMTGTAKTAEKEFADIYNLEVIVLPTNKPMIRKDFPDLVYQTELSKWKAVLEQSKKCYEKGQPVLIGTTTVEKSEFLSDLFKISNIPHQVLNAKPENLVRENEIIAQAGKLYAITIATNMAGRGTDIILGGNAEFLVKEKLIKYCLLTKEQFLEEIKNQKYEKKEKLIEFYEKIKIEYLRENNKLIEKIKELPLFLDEGNDCLTTTYNWMLENEKKEWKKNNKKIKELGGLFVLGTERHETRRIDNQLRGRAGRQGDPGISQFFVSLEDDLIKLFGGANLKGWVNYLLEDENIPLQSDFLTKGLENAQKKIEDYNYDIRKNVFQYDDVLNAQRKKVLKARNELLFNNTYEKLFLRYLEITIDKNCNQILTEWNKNRPNSKEKTVNIWKKKKTTLTEKTILEKSFGAYSFEKINLKTQKNKNNLYKEIWIKNDLCFASSSFYEKGFIKKTRENLLLSLIDIYWTKHIERMSSIKETINWRAYGQQNPLNEYNLEAFKSFKSMFEQIRISMIYSSLNSPIHS